MRTQDYIGQHRYKCLPKEGTVKLGLVDRAVGRVIHIRLQNEPETDAEKDLARDCFYVTHKPNPVLKEAEQVSASQQVNLALMDWALDNDAFQKARQASVNNLPAAISSASVLWTSLMSDDSIKAALDKQKEAEEKEEESKERVGQSAQASKDGYQELAQELLEQAQELQQEANELADEALARGSL